MIAASVALEFKQATTRFRAGVAQLVEQLICNQQVAGSSPIAGSKFGKTGRRSRKPLRYGAGAAASWREQPRRRRENRIVVRNSSRSAALSFEDEVAGAWGCLRSYVFLQGRHESRTERYRSGQTGQTVNLLSYDFGGSNPPLSTTRALGRGGADEVPRQGRKFSAGIAQLARASAFQAEGRGFESRFPLQRCPDSQWNAS